MDMDVMIHQKQKNWFIETIEQIGCFNLKIYAIKIMTQSSIYSWKLLVRSLVGVRKNETTNLNGIQQMDNS